MTNHGLLLCVKLAKYKLKVSKYNLKLLEFITKLVKNLQGTNTLTIYRIVLNLVQIVLLAKLVGAGMGS